MINIKELRRLAQAALTGPDGASLNWLKLLQDFQQEANPAVINELLDRLELAESRQATYKKAFEISENTARDLTEKVIPNIRNQLEAAEKDIALKERIIDSIGSILTKVVNERDELRAKIEAMEQQKPAGTLHDDGCFVWSTPRPYDSNYAGWKMKLYLAPGAQPAPVDDSATIAGLESAVTHLSVLLDSFRALLVEVNDVCGRDGHGGQLEDGESEIIDKVRAAISMTEAPPCAKGE